MSKRKACDDYDCPLKGSAYNRRFNVACKTCGAMRMPAAPGLRSWESMLGATTFRTAERKGGDAPVKEMRKWLRELSPYMWPLWRDWKGPAEPLKVETLEQVRSRQIRVKPRVHATGCGCVPHGDQSGCIDYPWKLWHQHKETRRGKVIA